MARIVCSVYFVRDPVGGIVSWNLQWLAGLQALGHDVWVVENANYPQACLDPVRRLMSNDPQHGLKVAREALEPYGLADRMCFVDYYDAYHGVPRPMIETVLRSADLLLDLGNHGAWLDEARDCGARVLVDGEPAYTQMKMVLDGRAAASPQYDHHYTNGANVGTSRSSAPTAGRAWRHVFNPVMTSTFDCEPPPAGAPFTTIMHWQAHSPVSFEGRTYGQKDVEFERFIDLPMRVSVPLEIAVAGALTPSERLQACGWRLEDSYAVTATLQAYRDYLAASAGEFSVCKNVFVATRSGWFSDRSAAYLASGRAVVIQDTGIEHLLPCGAGLFAVDTVEEAAEAIARIGADYAVHSKAARGIAAEHLDTRVVLPRLMREIGLA